MVGKLQDYLASDESIVYSWEGEIIDGGSSRKGVLAVTDRRVAYLAGESFKDIEYSHITSVETEVEAQSDVDIPQATMILGGIAVMGGVFTIGMGAELFSLFVIVLGVIIGVKGYRMRGGNFDEATPGSTHTVSIITGDETDQELTFETDENVGAEISSTLREKGKQA